MLEENRRAISRGEHAIMAGPVLSRQTHPLRKSGQDSLAVWITNKVGSMWAAYLFGFLALVSLPAAIASRNLIVIVSWIAQTFLQLVLLPIILVGQRVQQAHADARAEQDHTLHVSAHAKLDELLRRPVGNSNVVRLDRKRE